MKKIYLLGLLAIGAAGLTGCNDFLDDNRLPLSQQVNNAQFWNSTQNVQGEINYFYNDFQAYGNGSGTSGTFYFSWLSDDQCGRRAFANWTFTNVPATSGNWNDPYTEIRRANLIIEGVASSTLLDDEKTNFTGIARLHRAMNYFKLVKRYGDVPLITTSLTADSTTAAFAPRENRNNVMDYVLADLDYAVNNIATKANKNNFSSDMAQAVKAEICLFEGAYAKYHLNDAARAERFYKEVVKAGEAIAASYPIGDDYSALYRSFRLGGGGYNGLSNNSEVIFMKGYEQGVFMHSLIDYSSASDGVAGITKDVFDSYLLKDGTFAPEGSDKGEVVIAEAKDKDGQPVYDKETGEQIFTIQSFSIQNLLDARDGRLALTTYPMAMYPGNTYKASNTAAMWSRSGYGVSKFNNFTIPENDVNTANRQYTSAPLYWGARLYLAILEAKAELGTITDADITTYFKPLWERAGIDTSNLNLAYLQNMDAPDNDSGVFGPAKVSSLIWEIRRNRRCELIMDDDVRYWDLVRWHELKRLDTSLNPDAALGLNVSMLPNDIKLDNAPSYVSGDYLDCSYGNVRKWNDRYYLYPIPSGQIALYNNWSNNPGWE